MAIEKNPIKIKFIDFWHGDSDDEVRQKNPIYNLLLKRFNIELSDDPSFVIYSCYSSNFLKYRCPRIFYTGENVRPNFIECDYAFTFDYLDNSRHYRLPLYKFYADMGSLVVPKKLDKILGSKIKFCSFLVSNPNARERIDFFNRLSAYKKVDSGGKILNNIGYRIQDRKAFLEPYKFSIAFENASYPGYTTEKLIMPWLCNTVPIYWGNPLIHQEFNPKAFINVHEYDSFDSVVGRISEIDQDDELYLEYLRQPLFLDNRVPDNLTDEAILDQFSHIFSKKIDPVGLTLHNTYAKMKYFYLNSKSRISHKLKSMYK